MGGFLYMTSPRFHKYDDDEKGAKPFGEESCHGLIIEDTDSNAAQIKIRVQTINPWPYFLIMSSCPKTSAPSAFSAVNTSPQFRPRVLVRWSTRNLRTPPGVEPPVHNQAARIVCGESVQGVLGSSRLDLPPENSRNQERTVRGHG